MKKFNKKHLGNEGQSFGRMSRDVEEDSIRISGNRNQTIAVMAFFLALLGLLIYLAPDSGHTDRDVSDVVSVGNGLISKPESVHGINAEWIPPGGVDTSTFYTVVRVIDGDTFVAVKGGTFTGHNRVVVRVLGVDTPETVHPELPVEFYGPEASDFAKDFLDGQRVWFGYRSSGAKYDIYDRLLAYVYRVEDGSFFNLELIRGGYAEVYRRFPCDFRELFDYWEKEARRNGIGLWNAT